MEHLQVSEAQWRQIWPNAPQPVIGAFAAKSQILINSGVLATRTRLAFFCANIEHECGGFTIRNLTENIMYTASRMAAVWPSRFPGGASDVARKYGSAPGWQTSAVDDIYGDRMGNRPGTHDGSLYIGRGGPQWTGRDGYSALQAASKLTTVNEPTLAGRPDLQPEVCAAFWTWKGLNRFADANDFLGCVKSWNGGTNGLADRKAQMAGNNPVIGRLQLTADMVDMVNAIDAPLLPAQHPIGNVAWIQDSLNKLDEAGIIRLAAPLETKTGIYGQKTHDAVEAFQRKFEIKPYDGIAGTLTIPRIEEVLSRVAA